MVILPTKKHTLREARCAFTHCLSLLVQEAEARGYEAAYAEGMDRITPRDQTTDHMRGSSHEIGLAQDVDLYKNSVYQDKTEQHKELGEWWEQLGKTLGFPLRWGGRWGDGNHYSWEWKGIK